MVRDSEAYPMPDDGLPVLDFSAQGNPNLVELEPLGQIGDSDHHATGKKLPLRIDQRAAFMN